MQFDRAQAEYAVQTYSDIILRLSYTYLNSTHDAEDICQTVLMKFLMCGVSFENPQHEKAWILRATANACKDVLRSAWRRRTCGLDACAEMAAPPAHSEDSVLWAVQALPEKYRIPIYLHYYEGYKIREIADLIGVRPGTVNSRLNRGRERLKEMLGGIMCE